MPRPDKVETLDDVKLWIADHDGRIDAWWNEQHRNNKDDDKRFGRIEVRLTALEKRVMWLAGAAAAIGGLIGTLVSGGFT